MSRTCSPEIIHNLGVPGISRDNRWLSKHPLMLTS